MNNYKKAIEKRRSVDKLHDLGCGIDSVRFFSDEMYKVDSVLGLAMYVLCFSVWQVVNYVRRSPSLREIIWKCVMRRYEERDKLDLALSLGAEYDVSSEDIMLGHVRSLFLSRNLTLLTERLKEPIVVNTLKQKPAYAAER